MSISPPVARAGQLDLEGQVAVVTGGSSGIGLAVARELDRRGCRVVVASRDARRVEEAARSLTRGLGFGNCDVRLRSRVEALFAFTAGRLGPVDILVMSAGIGRGETRRAFPDPVARMSEDDWDQVLDTNLRGVFLAASAAARQMVPRRRGQIVDISSARGALGGHAYGAGYCASKMAARAIVEALKEELAPFGIRVVSVLPDAVDTGLIRGTGLAHRGAMAPERVGCFVADLLSTPLDVTLEAPLLAPFSVV